MKRGEREQCAGFIAAQLKAPREIQRIAYDPVSLESPVGEDEGSTLGDFIVAY